MSASCVPRKRRQILVASQQLPPCCGRSFFQTLIRWEASHWPLEQCQHMFQVEMDQVGSPELTLRRSPAQLPLVVVAAVARSCFTHPPLFPAQLDSSSLHRSACALLPVSRALLGLTVPPCYQDLSTDIPSSLSSRLLDSLAFGSCVLPDLFWSS